MNRDPPKASGSWGRSPRCGVKPHMKLEVEGCGAPLRRIQKKNYVSPECNAKVKYKIDHSSKTKNRTKKNSGLNNSDQDIAHLLFFWTTKSKKMTEKTWKLWKKSIITKKKIGFFFSRFSFVSERFSTIWTKNSKRPFLREGGECRAPLVKSSKYSTWFISPVLYEFHIIFTS